jgi:hypothetical protein
MKAHRMLPKHMNTKTVIECVDMRKCVDMKVKTKDGITVL